MIPFSSLNTTENNTQKRILIADDSAFMRNNLKMILKQLGYVIAGEAEDGFKAIELYKKLNPDIVTLDITMPNCSGIEALKEIKKSDKNARVIMCSAMGQKYYLEDAFNNGALDFIIKPFKAELIAETLEKVLNK